MSWAAVSSSSSDSPLEVELHVLHSEALAGEQDNLEVEFQDHVSAQRLELGNFDELSPRGRKQSFYKCIAAYRYKEEISLNQHTEMSPSCFFGGEHGSSLPPVFPLREGLNVLSFEFQD